MESSIMRNASRFLREQKKNRRWRKVLICLALVVAVGTVAVLVMPGRALNQTVRVLDCQIEVHQHTSECYGGDGTTLICGLADYVAHTHNELCYNEDGELICTLPEIEGHTHTDDCYKEERILTCGLEETAGENEEVPSQEATSPEEGSSNETVSEPGDSGAETVPASETETLPDVSGNEVVTENDVPAAEAPGVAESQSAPHVHTDACYTVVRTLICGQLETVTHEHSEACFKEVEVTEAENSSEAEESTEEPVSGGDEVSGDEVVYYCGLEEHTHDENCYEEVTGTDGSTEKVLVCGLEEHAHDESCLAEPAPEVIYYCGLEEHTHDESCYEIPDVSEGDVEPVLVCDKEEHTHDETCLIVPIYEKLYEDASLRVTATYPATANIPENAQFIVERMAEESEDYEQYSSEAENLMSDINPEVVAVLNIGFYLEDGTEFSPEQPVTINIQFLNDEGLEIGEPITVVHFAESGMELIGSSSIDEETKTEFTTSEFSPFAFLKNGKPVTIADNFAENAILNFNPDLHKTIDYLGNNKDESGNTLNGSENNNSFTDEDDSQKSGPKNNYADDLYRIDLDITGGQSKQGVDLLIVLDLSSSMEKTSSGGKTERDSKIWKVLNGDGKKGLIEEFLDASPSGSQVAAVYFSGHFASHMEGEQIYWDPVEDKAPNNITESGVIFNWTTTYTRETQFNRNSKFAAKRFTSAGVDDMSTTNYVAGLIQANNMLNKVKENNHKKIVLFISDGLPTQYYMYDDVESHDAWNNINAVMPRYGQGTDALTYRRAAFPNTDLFTPYVRNYFNNSSAYQEAVENKDFCNDGYAIFNALGDPQASPYVNETLLAFEKFKELNSDIIFYGIGIDLKDLPSTGLNANFKRGFTLEKMAGDEDHYFAFNDSNLEEALTKKVREILFPKGVEVQDTLSQYVELYTTPNSTRDVTVKPEVEVTETPGNAYADVVVYAKSKSSGEIIKLWSGYGLDEFGGAKDPSSQNKLLGEEVVEGVKVTDTTIPITLEDGSTTTKVTQQIVVKFKEEYFLSSQYTYHLSFNVRMTDDAYNTYARNKQQNTAAYKETGGSPHTGDFGTDYSGNGTSSGKEGFYSNEKASAKYVIENKQKEEMYDKPVTQVWGTGFSLKKENEYADDIKTKDARFLLQKKDGSGSYSIPIDPESSGGRYGTTHEYYVDENGYITYGLLEIGDYMLTETGYPKGYVESSEPIYFSVSRGNIVVDKLEQKATDISAFAYKWTIKEERNYPNQDHEDASVLLTITNDFDEPKAKIYKQDDSDDRVDGQGNRPMLEGVGFSVYEAEDCDAQGNPNAGAVPAATGTTNEKGLVIWKTTTGSIVVGDGISDYIPVGEGTYYLVETKPLPGYDGTYLPSIKFEVSNTNGEPTIMFEGSKLTVNDGKWDVEVGGTAESKKVIVTTKNKLRKFDITLYKVSDNYTGADLPLAGAYFELYKLGYTADELVAFEAADGTTTRGKRIYPVDAGGNKAGEYFITGADGMVDLGILEYGHYYLKEVQAPDGYNTPPVDIKFMVNEAADGSGTITVDETYASDDYVENVVVTDDGRDEYPDLMIQVTNYRGAALPETGGEGIYLYLMSGLALVLMAAITLMYKSKFRKAGR